MRGPLEQPCSEDGDVQDESLVRVARVVAGQLLDLGQPVGDGADRHVQAPGSLGGDLTGREVRIEGLQQRLGAAAGLGQRPEDGLDEIDDGGLVADQDPVDEHVAGIDHGRVELQPLGELSASRASS